MKSAFMTFLATALLLAPLAPGQAARELVRTEKFKTPDVRNDFCGVHINFQYCKCAFHDEYCGAIGMSKSAAGAHVNAKFEAYVADLRERFSASCEITGGEFDAGSDACRYYDGEAEPPPQEEALASAKAEAADGCELPADFEAAWQTYSDFDRRIPRAEASHEVKQFYAAMDKLAANNEARYLVRRDMEIDRLMREELRAYKQALVKDLKTNLLKAFWRLAWMTYDTAAGASTPGKYAQGAADLGVSYAKLFDPDVVPVAKWAVALKTVRSLTPKDSKLALDTEKTAGKFGAISTSTGIAILENIEELGEAAGALGAAKDVVQEIQAQVLPGADLSDEEIDILRTQHLDGLAVDDALQESYRLNRERRLELDILEQERADHLAEAERWIEAEKDRVKTGILEDCEE